MPMSQPESIKHADCDFLGVPLDSSEDQHRPPQCCRQQAHTQKKTPVLWFYWCFLFYNSELHAEKNHQIRDELHVHVNCDGRFRHMHPHAMKDMIDGTIR